MGQLFRLHWAAACGLVLMSASAGCSTPTQVPEGYERIGVADGATLFVSRESDARVSVVLRGRQGETLCSASGPVAAHASEPLPALCDDTSGDTYAYVLPVTRGGSMMRPATCNKESGAPEPVTLVRSPSSRGQDFLVAVRPESATHGIVVCEP